MENGIVMHVALGLIMAQASWAQNDNRAANRTINGPVEAQLHEHVENAMENPKGDPNLPRVLIIGDSISIGYTVPVRQYLQDKATVHRPPENCQHTAYGLAHLKAWLGTGTWDVIHFNWGIWDTHYLNAQTGAIVSDESKLAPEQMRVRHTPEAYGRNLARLVEIIQGTGAQLIWASSTPLMFRKGDRFEDIAKYNTVAAKVMKERGIPIDDLYAFTLPEVTQWQSQDKCHFNALGNKNLGMKVGRSILDTLTDNNFLQRQLDH